MSNSFSRIFSGLWEVSPWARISVSACSSAQIGSLVWWWARARCPDLQTYLLCRLWHNISEILSSHNAEGPLATVWQWDRFPSGVMQHLSGPLILAPVIQTNQRLHLYNCFPAKHLDTGPPPLMKTTRTDKLYTAVNKNFLYCPENRDDRIIFVSKLVLGLCHRSHP